MTKSEIKKRMVQLAFEGRLFNLEDESQRDRFLGSVDRYSEVITAFQGRERVLDVGSEGGGGSSAAVCTAGS